MCTPLDKISLAHFSSRALPLSMEDKMAAGAFGRATNYGFDGPLKCLCHGPILELFQLHHRSIFHGSSGLGSSS